MYPHNMKHDMAHSGQILELVMDLGFATELYGAMCNMRWYKLPDDEADSVIHRLTYPNPEDYSDDDCWSTSWRTSGDIVAGLRNPTLREKGEELEGYMDWYCQGGEGHVTKRVKQTLAKLGWYSVPWPEDHGL